MIIKWVNRVLSKIIGSRKWTPWYELRHGPKSDVDCLCCGGGWGNTGRHIKDNTDVYEIRCKRCKNAVLYGVNS